MSYCTSCPGVTTDFRRAIRAICRRWSMNPPPSIMRPGYQVVRDQMGAPRCWVPVLRGIAWAGRQENVDRFLDLTLVGARFSP